MTYLENAIFAGVREGDLFFYYLKKKEHSKNINILGNARRLLYMGIKVHIVSNLLISDSSANRNEVFAFLN